MTIFSATFRNNVVILFCELSGRSATIIFSAALQHCCDIVLKCYNVAPILPLKIVVAHQCQEDDITTVDFQQRFLAQHGVVLLPVFVASRHL